jgi:hypothetical protein
LFWVVKGAFADQRVRIVASDKIVAARLGKLFYYYSVLEASRIVEGAAGAMF